MATALRKATFNLHEEVLQAVHEAVERGAAPSKNALVERALKKELRELRRAARRDAWDRASKDPLFLREVAEVEEAFAHADAETARQIP